MNTRIRASILLAAALLIPSLFAGAQDLAQAGAPAAARAAGNAAVTTVAFSSDGTLAYSATKDQKFILWDVASRKELRRFEGSNPGFSPDGRSLAATVDALVILFDTRSGAQSGMKKYSFAGNAFCFSPDGEKLAVASGKQGTVTMRNLGSGEVVQEITRGIGPVQYLWFSSDNSLLIVRSDAILSATDIAPGGTGLSRDHIRLGSGGDPCVAISSDGYLMICRDDAVSAGATVLRIETVFSRSQGDRTTPLAAPVAGFRTAFFSPDDRSIVTLSDPAGRAAPDSTLLLWDASDGRLLAAPLAASAAAEHDAACFSRDGRRLLVTSRDAPSGETALLLYDPSAATLSAPLDAGKRTITAAALSPDGSVALTGDADGTVQFHQTADAR